MTDTEQRHDPPGAPAPTGTAPDRRVIEQLAQVWTSVASLCDGLSDAAWSLPTDCPGWNVHDQLAHLTGTEAWLLGRQAPRPGPERPDHVRNKLGAVNEAWVDALRPLPGRRLLGEFRSVTAARLRALLAMSDEELSAATDSPIGRVPYAAFMEVRVMDCWIHEQDMRRALGLADVVEGAPAETALRRLALLFPLAVGKRVAPPEGTTVVLELTGPLARTLAVVMAGGRAVPTDPPEHPTTGLRTDTATFLRIAAGRLDAAAARQGGRVAVTGDPALGAAVLDNLAGIP